MTLWCISRWEEVGCYSVGETSTNTNTIAGPYLHSEFASPALQNSITDQHFAVPMQRGPTYLYAVP